MTPKNKKLLPVVEIGFEMAESPYNPEFVAKASKKDVVKGRYITVDPNKSIWENLK